MQLPLGVSFEAIQTQWRAILNPLLARPTNNMTVLPNISLKVGDNVINTFLGKMQTGWVIMDINGASTIYRSAAFTDTTLTLNSSAVVTITLGVF